MPSGVIDLFSQIADNDFGFFQRITSLSGIMTPDVENLTLDHTFEQAIELLRRQQFCHAPVVDEDGHVVGVISDRDLLRHQPPTLGSAAEGDKDHLALRTPVSQIMTRGPLTVSLSDSPILALELMIDHHVDCVLVHDEDSQLAGVVTPRDFMKMVLLFHKVCTRGPDLVRFRLVDLDLKRGLPLDVIFSRGTRSVRDVMCKSVKCLAKSDSIVTAMELMQTLQVRHLPVVDESSRLIGMVSDRQILRALPSPKLKMAPRSTPAFREALFAVENARMLQHQVAELLVDEPHAVEADSLFTEAVERFINEPISGLAVLGEDGELCGILTTTDVLRVFCITLKIGLLLDNKTSQ